MLPPNKQAMMGEYCYRFVKDGCHLHSSRIANIGFTREIVEEVPVLKGWAVRVPWRWTREMFENQFTCGPYDAKNRSHNWKLMACK